MNSNDLRAWKQKIGCTWKAMAEAVGVAPNTMRRWARGDLQVGNPTMLRLSLERLENTGLMQQVISSRKIRLALAGSTALAECDAATERLLMARQVLRRWLTTQRKQRTGPGIQKAFAEHSAAVKENRGE